MEGVPPDKIKVIGAGINTEAFRPLPPDKSTYEQYGLDGNEKIVLYIGSLLRSKGVYDLILAAKYLQEQKQYSQPVRFLLFGKGPEETGLRQMVQALNLDSIVKILGSAPYQQIPEIHRLADIFVLPSVPTPEWQEQFGMVLVESMATGRAIVTTCSGAIPEVVGEAAVIVPPACSMELGAAIHALLVDDVKRSELGQLARQRVEQLYSHQVVANQIAQAYEGLINANEQE